MILQLRNQTTCPIDSFVFSLRKTRLIINLLCIKHAESLLKIHNNQLTDSNFHESLQSRQTDYLLLISKNVQNSSSLITSISCSRPYRYSEIKIIVFGLLTLQVDFPLLNNWVLVFEKLFTRKCWKVLYSLQQLWKLIFLKELTQELSFSSWL